MKTCLEMILGWDGLLDFGVGFAGGFGVTLGIGLLRFFLGDSAGHYLSFTMCSPRNVNGIRRQRSVCNVAKIGLTFACRTQSPLCVAHW